MTKARELSPSGPATCDGSAEAAGIADADVAGVGVGVGNGQPSISTVGATAVTDPVSGPPENVTVPSLSSAPQSVDPTEPKISSTSNTPSGTVSAKQLRVVPLSVHTFDPDPMLHTGPRGSSSITVTFVAVPGPAFSKVITYVIMPGAVIAEADGSFVRRMSGSGGGSGGQGTSTVAWWADRARPTPSSNVAAWFTKVPHTPGSGVALKTSSMDAPPVRSPSAHRATSPPGPNAHSGGSVQDSCGGRASNTTTSAATSVVGFETVTVKTTSPATSSPDFSTTAVPPLGGGSGAGGTHTLP